MAPGGRGYLFVGGKKALPGNRDDTEGFWNINQAIN